LPERFQQVREATTKAISPVHPADESTKASSDLSISAQRTHAGRQLPPYYVVYFLLVDLLGFRNLGRFEKLACPEGKKVDRGALIIEKQAQSLFMDRK
jgi:hypothetical protein